jgi:hypothetical protein
MKHATPGLVAAGCPLGALELVKEHADAAAGKVVESMERVLVLPLSAQDRQLLLHRSLHSKILHLSRLAMNQNHSNGSSAPSRKSFPALFARLQ